MDMDLNTLLLGLFALQCKKRINWMNKFKKINTNPLFADANVILQCLKCIRLKYDDINRGHGRSDRVNVAI